MMLPLDRTVLFILLSLVVLYSPGNIAAKCIDGDCINGQGTYIWPNGDKYAGEWKDGKPNGQGSFIWPEGDKFVSDWNYDSNNGQGKYISPAGATLYLVDLTNGDGDEPGCIQGDCVNGYGIYTWVSGAKYAGSFENGERNGPGTYSFANGRSVEGIWNNGRYVGKTEAHSSNWGG